MDNTTLYKNLIEKYRQAEMPGNGRIKLEFHPDSVHVHNSFCVSRRKDMRLWIDFILNSKQCPSAVSCRSTRSLLREWEAHNMLYSFGYEVERTQHVDFDQEPFSRQFVYLLLSIAYRSRIF